eukprot:4275077-Pyramimonas_sp.AAC.1
MMRRRLKRTWRDQKVASEAANGGKAGGDFEGSGAASGGGSVGTQPWPLLPVWCWEDRATCQGRQG